MADRLTQLQDMVNTVSNLYHIQLKCINKIIIFYEFQQAEHLCNSIGT